MRRCPNCDSTRAWELADGRFKCRSCGKRFTRRSVWDASRLSDRTKHRLVELFALGVPVYRQRFRAPVSLPTLERFYRLLRACCAYVEELREPFDGELECDESMFGAPRKGGKRGWGAPNKVIIFGILKRNGIVKVFPLPKRSGKQMQQLIQEHTRPGSLYYTDDWRAYASLAVRGDHITIRKKDGRPKGRDHINGIEGYWSYAKHWLYPYRGVPRKYFHLYLAEISYRFNHRQEDLKPLLIGLLRRVEYHVVRKILVRIP